MLTSVKRIILKAVEFTGYEIIHRRRVEASGDATPPATTDAPAEAETEIVPDERMVAKIAVAPAAVAEPIAVPLVSDESMPAVATAAPPEPDYQLLMARQELMAKLEDLDEASKPIIEAVRPFTMTSIERLFDLYKSVEYLVKAGVPGDILECGVWRGGSMMLVARTLLAFGDASRVLYLLDTFEGHPKPDGEKDLDLWGNDPLNEWINYRKTEETSDWAYVSIDEARTNMASTGYPMDKVVLVKGMVEKTAVTIPARPLALVRLDTDWYASAKIGLETFWPLLVRKGILVIDDYGHYRGQRQAVDEYFATTPIKLNRIDYSCRTVLKVD